MRARTCVLYRPTAVALAALAAAAGAFAAGADASVPTPDASTRFEAARDQYERGHYPVAFDEFAALADGGHCEAARVAHQMARHGSALYGVTFAVAPARLEHWRRLPGCPASEPGAR